MRVLDMGGGRLASIHRNYISGHLYMAWTMTTSHIVTQSQKGGLSHNKNPGGGGSAGGGGGQELEKTMGDKT